MLTYTTDQWQCRWWGLDEALDALVAWNSSASVFDSCELKTWEFQFCLIPLIKFDLHSIRFNGKQMVKGGEPEFFFGSI